MDGPASWLGKEVFAMAPTDVMGTAPYPGCRREMVEHHHDDVPTVPDSGCAAARTIDPW